MEDMGKKLIGHYKVMREDTKPEHFKREKCPRGQKGSNHKYNCSIAE